MERALQEFNLQEAQDFQDKDPYQTYQVSEPGPEPSHAVYDTA